MSALAKARARQALADAGLPSEGTLEPLRSVTNEVWLSDEYLIRLNRRQDGRLQKELAIGGLLPPALSYPEVVAYGGEPGGDWLIVRRPRGRVLSQAWPHLAAPQRNLAIQHLGHLLQTVHSLPAPAELPEIDDPPLLVSVDLESPTASLVEAINRLAPQPNIDAGFMEETLGLVRDLTLSLEPFRATTMVHGDVHFENILWDGARAHTLLDWKWARPAPPTSTSTSCSASAPIPTPMWPTPTATTPPRTSTTASPGSWRTRIRTSSPTIASSTGCASSPSPTTFASSCTTPRRCPSTAFRTTTPIAGCGPS